MSPLGRRAAIDRRPNMRLRMRGRVRRRRLDPKIDDAHFRSGPVTISAKVLNSTEGAHVKDMSTFEIDEHLRRMTPLPRRKSRECCGQPEVTLNCWRSAYGRRANRMSRRVSGSLTPPKRAISISSRWRIASRPSSLSKLTGGSFSLTADHVASKALSKISRTSGSN